MAPTSTTPSTTPSSTATKKAGSKAKREAAASEQRNKEMRAHLAKPRQLFIPGSLNDQLSKLAIGESHARCQRIPLDNGNVDEINNEVQKFFKQQNSTLSGSIAKVRDAAEHKHKRFKMERGQYMSASNDALFAFLAVTRME